MGPPAVFTRRQFVASTAAAVAAAAGGVALGGCTNDPARPSASGTSAPASSAGPTSMRPATTTSTSPASTPPPTPTPTTDPMATIVAVAVHPAIGIARVGNSIDSFYFGPEVPGSLPDAPGGFKDATGAVARQAARFRIFGYDAAGAVVQEITSADAEITWTVSVANTKAAWYAFDRAMDLPVATAVKRRNADVTGDDRLRLVVASGERSIGGPGAAPVVLDAGRFLDEPVPLGELLTDELGRLVFLPGEGRGYAPGQAPLRSFANNDGWCDDTCDGPVLASVTIDGRTMRAEPGWVVVAPPNYGPAVRAGLVTAYDSSRLGWDRFDPTRLTAADVSFRTDILPIFSRIVAMQWVNAGYLGSHGWGSVGDLLQPELLARLADPSPNSASLRQDVFSQFRSPAYAEAQPESAPHIYGDGVSFPAESRYQWLAVTPIQHALLAAWAAGTFTDDRDVAAAEVLAELSPAAQVDALDRSGLDGCLGGAYHPGVEVPWTLRVPSMWAGPCRLRMRSTTLELRDEGDELTPERTMAADGPLTGSGPGDLTRWMSTPWHADAASCRSGYEPDISTVLPTFWPARVPNHVLRHADYLVVVDTGAPIAERHAAFNRRYDWQRFVAASNRSATLHNMVEHWGLLGVVTEQPGPADGMFPAVMLVETNVGFGSEPVTTWSAAWEEIDPLVWDGGPVTSSS